MTVRRKARAAGETRNLILEAAVRRFAQASYDETGLRDIAADVGVDVAYVHRSFGSKGNLFIEALTRAADDFTIEGLTRDALPDALAAQILAGSRKRAAGEISPLDIMIRSLTSPKAARLLAERMQADFLEPLSEKLDDPTRLRTAMIMSLLLGFGLLRNHLQLPAATAPADDQARQIVARLIGDIADGDIGRADITGPKD